MDVLEISPRILGRPPQPVSAVFVRALRVEDLELLEARQVQGGGNTPLQRISERHHAMARMAAQGMKTGEIAACLGFTEGRVSMLKGYPVIKELIEMYRGTLQGEIRSNFERLSGLASDAADLIQERLETEPEKVSTGTLLEIVKVAADRSGNGPVTGNVQMNLNVDMAQRMKQARERARAAAQIDLPLKEAEG